MCGHSDLGIFSHLGASSIFTWVSADTASTACPAHPGGLDITSITRAANYNAVVNCFLFLQYGLHDDLVMNFPNAVL